MTDHTPRDRALAGEVVKLSDQRLAEMQLEELLHASRHEYSELQWLHILNELIAARKEIERLTTRVAELEKERDANADDASALRLQASHALEEAQRFRFGLKKLLHATTHLGSVCGLDNSTALAWMEVWGATEIAKGLLCSDPSSSGATP